MTGRRAAWLEYLEATRGVREPDYSEVETWAWARLEHRLEQLAVAH